MIARLFLAAITITSGAFAAPALSTIQDLLYKADGTRFNGTLTISWNSFQAADNSTIVQQSTTVTVKDGNLRVQLIPSTTSTPAIYYSVVYNSDGKVQFREVWSVPSSGQSLKVRDVRVNTPSTSSGGPGGPAPAPQTGTIEQDDVIGLIADLEARPLKGPGFAPNRVAFINALGQIESVLGSEGDCIRVDGSTGPCGTVSPAFIDNEPPAGIVDGSNAVFTLDSTPDPESSLVVYRNGLLQKVGVDFSFSARTITFLPGAVPQSGDILTASYRVEAGDPGTPQRFPTAEVLCSGVGNSTSGAAPVILGSCAIPSGVLAAGNRVEVRFSLEHIGATSGFTAEVRWGASTVLQRSAGSTETSLVGRVDGGMYSTGAQLSVQSWGAVLTLASSVANTTDPYTSGLVIDLRGALAQSSGDTLALRNFSVVRLP